MAFRQEDWAVIGSVASDAPSHYSYTSTDTAAQILVPGYFSALKTLEADDMIWAAGSDIRHLIRFIDNDTPPYIVAPKPPVQVLFASEFTDQQPTLIDVPIQLKFGPAQLTSSDPVMIDALGNITINETGHYDVISTFRVGRLGSAGMVSKLYVRGLVNGVGFGNPTATFVDNPSIVIPELFTLNAFAPAGSVVTIEFYRDSAGPNEGGLFAATSAIGWGVAPSAVIRIFKLT